MAPLSGKYARPKSQHWKEVTTWIKQKGAFSQKFFPQNDLKIWLEDLKSNYQNKMLSLFLVYFHIGILCSLNTQTEFVRKICCLFLLDLVRQLTKPEYQFEKLINKFICFALYEKTNFDFFLYI